MKKRQHKWFRNDRYKLKLERDVDNHKTYYSNVFFITKEPDYEYINRRWGEYWPSWWTDEKSGNISPAKNTVRTTMFTMTVPVFPILSSIITNRPVAVHIASTSKRELTSVCVNAGSRKAKFINTMNIARFMSIGGNWTNRF